MNGHVVSLVALIVTSFAGVVLLVPVAQRLALTYGLVDKPRKERLHQSPIPYLGGAAIALTALGISVIFNGWKAEATVIVLCAFFLGVVGLVDDIRALNPPVRLAAETAGAAIAAAAGARVHIFGGPLDWVLTIAWLVVITNSFNLLDNMDGAASAIATATALGLLSAAVLEQQWLVAGLAASITGCALGFLVFNRPPARIFMGDAGSLFLGFLLATTALKLRPPVDHFASTTAVVLLAALALFDTSLVVITRVRSHRPIYVGGTDHMSHRLLRRGLPVGQVTLLLAGGAGLFSTLGVLVGQGVLDPVLAIAVAGTPFLGLMGWFLAQPDGVERAAVPPRQIGVAHAAAADA